MSNPLEHLVRSMKLTANGKGRAIDQEYRQSQLPRRHQFGLGTVAAGILADHQIDGMVAQQAGVVFDAERPAIDHECVPRQNRRPVRCIDEAQKIVMLRLGDECFHMHPAKCQQNPAGGAGKRLDRVGDVGDAGPVVSRDRVPRGTGEGGMGHVGDPGSFHGMRAHDRCERMRGVDQMGDAMIDQIRRQPRNATEAADANGHRLRARSLGASGVADRGRHPAFGQQASKSAGFGRSAQHQDIRHG